MSKINFTGNKFEILLDEKSNEWLGSLHRMYF